MTDLVERLREYQYPLEKVAYEAADAIEAATRMRNEIVGLCSLGEHHIREFAGNTNYNCLIDAVKEFDRVLEELDHG
ncbi:hypothetical protein LCGC14_2695060 [marine sediment metagenome]|uniref:Uncharacterized protein n=1 Tax=marine sediment metagenome TaxID=412755 RepID=A0A0F9BRV7_9ZZZZ